MGICFPIASKWDMQVWHERGTTKGMKLEQDKASDMRHEGIVASVAGQMSYPHGGNMCSTCATTLAMAFAAGLIPDPSTCSKDGMESMLSLIMMHSSRIQGQWLAGTLNMPSPSYNHAKKQQHDEQQHHRASARNSMKQVHEVVQLVKTYDTQGLWRTGGVVECFGPVLHADGCSHEMQMMNANASLLPSSSQAPQATPFKSPPTNETWTDGQMEGTRADGEKGNGEEEDAAPILVHGADILLERWMEDGDACALTFAGHSVCVYKSCKDQWYLFDPMHGGLLGIHGESRRVHEVLFAGASGSASKCFSERGLEDSSEAAEEKDGLREGTVYCGVIAKPLLQR